MKSGKLTRFNLRAVTAALASLVVLGGLGVGIYANAATLTNGTSTATVVRPITISQTTPLSFGRFSTPDTAGGGTVTIEASEAGVRGKSGGVVLIDSASGGIGAKGNSGVCLVSGEGGLTYTVSALTASNLTRSGGGAAMTLVISTAPAAVGTGTGVLSGAATELGTQTLYVGGVLTVAAAQTPGTYTGTYSVTVEYN